MTMTRKIWTLNPNEEVYTEYFFWLSDRISAEDSDEALLETLFDHEFYCLVPNDDNRVSDGKRLREAFSTTTSRHGAFRKMDAPCNMLEFLIGLSLRMDFILYSPYLEKRVEQWFWMMIENLNLKKQRRYKNSNKRILRRFVSREYDYNGFGGLFPLDYPSKDQREVEIWYQMMEYIAKVLQ